VVNASVRSRSVLSRPAVFWVIEAEKRLGAVLDGLIEQDRALRHRGLEPLDAGRERGLQRLGALLHGLVERGGPLRHYGFQRGQVLGGAVDHLGEAALLLAQAFEQAWYGLRHARLGLVHLLGGFA
jgi:hypothetical protein